MWKEAYGFNNYLCNENGEIYSLLSKKVMKTHSDKDGYQQLRMTITKGKAITVKAHRLIAQTFLPNPENKQCINHKDGNKKNNAVSNLEWCTAKENNKHARKVGLLNDYGINNSRAVCNQEVLDEIRQLISEGKGNTEIEKITGISNKVVSNIRRGRNYKKEREVL